MIRLTRRQWSKIFHMKINDDGFEGVPREELFTLEEYSKRMMYCSHHGGDKYIALALIGTFCEESMDDTSGTRWKNILTEL